MGEVVHSVWPMKRLLHPRGNSGNGRDKINFNGGASRCSHRSAVLMLACADEFIVQPGIDAAGGEQGVMCAAFDDFALGEHEDEVSFAYRAQAMGDDKSSAAFQQKFESVLKARFGD